MANRESATTQTNFRYFALPIEQHGNLIGFSRVAMPMETVNNSLSKIQRPLLLVSIAGSILVIIITVFTTGAIVKPIKKLTQMTQSVATGGLTTPVEVNTANELGQLSRNFNLMTDRVQTQIDRISLENQRLETILNSMSEGVLLVNGPSEITYANPAAICHVESSRELCGESPN